MCYKCKKPIVLVYDKLNMSINGLNSFNSPNEINNPRNIISATDNIRLDKILQNYFND